MRRKFTTTLEEDSLKKLDIIRVGVGFKGRNDVIEYLINKWEEGENYGIKDMGNGYEKNRELNK